MYTPPTTRPPTGETVFHRAAPHLSPRTKLPAPLLETMARFEEVSQFEHRAQRAVEYALKVLVPEHAAALKAHEADAVLHPPEDWQPFTPAPDVEVLRYRAKKYAEARIAAGREVDRASTGPKVFEVLSAAWLRANTPIPDSSTLAEAKVAEVMRAEALSAIGNAARSVILAAGASEVERKTFERALKAGTLLDLKAVRDHLAGRTEARLVADAKAETAKAQKREEDRAYAADNARRRVGGAEPV